MTNNEPDRQLVPAMLNDYGRLTREHLVRCLNAAPFDAKASDGERSPLAALVADYPQRGGKMLRSSICIAAARLFGASIDDAVASAVSIELLHNALLIHDDIQDGSAERRGAPTLHRLHGLPLALNAGDALGLLSLRPLKSNLARLGLGLGLRIFGETERMAWETTEGQALELAWRRDNRSDLDDEHYLRMVLKKTCWLTTIYPLRIGCLIGTRGRASLDPLIRFGFFVGAAFQIQDDLLNLDAGPGYGKECCGDLFEGKRTLMLIHALRRSPAATRRRLLRFLAQPRERRREADAAWVRRLIEDSGGIAHARAVAEALAGAARCEFERCFAGVPAGRDQRFLRALAPWALERLH